uniref:Uncharacterized protein n=1 Tax=Hyaloperonospora arabidopsidis (strain Emoy2) TaxID=559515 RepID=M4BNK8_HYAAE
MLLRCVRPLCPRAASHRLHVHPWRRFASTSSSNALEICVRERELPPFERLKLQEIEPAVKKAAANYTCALHELEKGLAKSIERKNVQFCHVVDPLEVLGDALGRLWGIVGHLMSVCNSDELRAVHDKLQELVIQTVTETSQSKTIYEAYVAVREGKEWNTLERAQQRVVELSLRSAELSGVGLDGDEQEMYNKLKLRTAELSTKFGSNLLDATKAYAMTVMNKDKVEGLPSSLLQMFAQRARDEGHLDATSENGPWRVTLDPPSYVQFMKYAANRSLREELYRAFSTRASSGAFDNENIVDELLKIRQQIANLLGFNSYAEVSISKKMAPSVEEVEKMHHNLRNKCVGIAREEVKTVAEYAKQHGQTEPLEPWDLGYWYIRTQHTLQCRITFANLAFERVCYRSEQLKAKTYLFTDEEIKPYFPLERVGFQISGQQQVD